MATLLYRLGAFGARRRRTVMAGWPIALAAVVGLGISWGGSTWQPTDPVGKRA